MKLSYAVIIGGAIFIFFAVVMVAVFIPGWIWQPPQTTAAHEYTAQELLGQKVYYSNGCDYCHTQYVRYYDADFTGPVSQGGNYVYDHPLTLGSERTGPDLSYIGRKRDFQWEIDHLNDPRKYSPMSIMPKFNFLSEEEKQAEAAYLFALGDRVAGQHMIQPTVEYAHLTNPIHENMPQYTVNTDVDNGWEIWNSVGLQEAKILYVDRCIVCHGCSGNGLGDYAQTKVVTPADFKQEPFKSMTEAEFFWHISEGVQGSVMPPWRESLTEEQRWRVALYVMQIFAQPSDHDPHEGDPSGAYAGVTNPLPKAVETLNAGKTTYTRECMICHGDAGTGNGPYSMNITPRPADFTDHSSYGTIDAPIYTDADWFWRISEGVPWTAMPSWKVKFTETERWQLAYFIQVNLAIVQPRPAVSGPEKYPPIYLAQTAPVDLTGNDVDVGNQNQLVYRAPDPELGKTIFATYCAECHGFDGLGNGWNAQFLDVKPANFTSADVRGLGEGDWFARVSFGLQNSAMPVWGEWMPEQDRWDAISFVQKYILTASTDGKPTFVPSVFTTGQEKVDAIYTLVDSGIWTDEEGAPDPKHGEDLFTQYCASCHGDKGQGLTPENAPAGLKYPSPFPAGLNEPMIFQAVAAGIPNSLMPSFRVPYSKLFTQSDIWDIIIYLTGGQ